MKTRQLIITAVGIVVLLALGFGTMTWLASKKVKQERKAPLRPPPNVAVTAVKYVDVDTELEYFGRVGSFQSADIITEVQGRILKGAVNLKAGQRVRAGQLLVKIDDKEARLNLKSQKSQFQRSIADMLADLKLDYPDIYPSFQTYFDQLDVSKPLPALPEIQGSQAKTFLSTRGIYSTYYSILSADERLTKYRVTAPFSGSISEVFLEPGSVANPGTRIAKLKRTDRLELILPVRSADLQWLKRGTEVEISTEDGKTQSKGKVERIGEQVDASTQSVNVYVSIQNSATAVYDGQYLQARIPGKVVRSAMTVPRKTVFDDNKVWVASKDQLESREIVVHKVNSGTVIFSGLDPGTQLITEPPVNALEGMRIKTIAGK